LLILISIGAIAVVSVFIFNLVSDNLGGTDCFKTVNQFEILAGDDGSSCYDSNTTEVFVTVERGPKGDYNLTAIDITVGNAEISKTFEQLDDLPGEGEKRTYTINVSGSANLSGGPVTTVAIVPIIGKDRSCEEGKSQKEIDAC
jgi:hypothetical protein